MSRSPSCCDAGDAVLSCQIYDGKNNTPTKTTLQDFLHFTNRQYFAFKAFFSHRPCHRQMFCAPKTVTTRHFSHGAHLLHVLF